MSEEQWQLALSFFVFVQRLHQFVSMKKIAEDLEAKLVDGDELKAFLANICVESYADVVKFHEERAELEKQFPTYCEETECGLDQRWSEWKFGRVPSFLYSDANRSYVATGNGMDAYNVEIAPCAATQCDTTNAYDFCVAFGRTFKLQNEIGQAGRCAVLENS